MIVMTHLSVPSFWRANKPRYCLVGVKCRVCGRVLFPPRTACSACGSVDLDEYRLPRSGLILSWTTIHAAPKGFEAPYTIALVRLEDGVVVAGCVVGGGSQLEIGAPVEVVFRRVGETTDGLLLYGFKFKLKET